MPSANPAPAQDRESARQLQARGEERLRFGDLSGAREALTQALVLDGEPAESHYLLGNCLRRLKLADEAEAAFKAALTRDTDMARAWFGLSFLYQENGRRVDAAENLRGLVRHFASNREVLHQAGGVMGDFGLYADASALYEEMVTAEPEARNYQRLGQFYQKQGRFQEAGAALLQALELNPDAGAAYLLLANTRRFKPGDAPLLQRFTQALARPESSPTTRVCLHFALGKMLDDMERYDEAFRHFEQGNGLRHPGQYFDAGEWEGFARRVGLVDGKALAPQWTMPGGTAPVFVVGMLRSGTTLVERILASHSKVSGLGEVTWLEELVTQAVQDGGSTYPEVITRLDEVRCTELRREYARHWPQDARDAAYIVDKNPLNFIYLGFIARVFPDARIVHCRRDARDSCLSVYFQNFANPQNNYAYDQRDIGRFYRSYAEIMGHWRRLLPRGMLIEVDYEKLVGHQEQTTRRLLEELGLPWDPRCLEFHSQPDVIATASVWQARQPLYNASVGRWRHYERHLKPLLDILGPL